MCVRLKIKNFLLLLEHQEKSSELPAWYAACQNFETARGLTGELAASLASNSSGEIARRSGTGARSSAERGVPGAIE